MSVNDEIGLDDLRSFEFATEMDDTEPPDFEAVTTKQDEEFAQQAEETARARKYRKRVSAAMGNIWRPMLDNPRTVHDAAAILQYGPDIARATGTLADTDEKARKVVDFILDGSENAYLNLAAASIPLFFQLIRNHEEAIKPEIRQIRIWKWKIGFKFGIRLGRLRNISTEPAELSRHVFSQPHIIEALNRQGLRVANVNAASANGSARRR